LVHVDASGAGRPKKRLAGALCIDDILARPNDASRTLSRSLVGIPLAVGDNLGNVGDFGLEPFFGPQNFIDVFIASSGIPGQFAAKFYHAVVGGLQGCFVGAVLFCDLTSLIRALTKRLSNGFGRHSLLPREGSRGGALQRVMKLREVRLDRSAISESAIDSGYRCYTHPLRANEQWRPFTGRIIRRSHLHNRRIAKVASSESRTAGCMSGSEL
jgi:hypothetical protein